MTASPDLENSSCKMQQYELSFATTNKNKPMLILEDYLFKCNKTTISKKYWVCIEKGCGVYIHTSVNNEFISISNGHNHAANPDQVEIKLLRDKMKERILIINNDSLPDNIFYLQRFNVK